MTVYNQPISNYIAQWFASEDEALQRAREDAPQYGLPAISIKPEEGRFLQFLIRAAAACKVIEIGTLGGYSGTWIARGLPPDGKLITLEKEPRHAEVARQNFVAADVQERVEIRVGDAHVTLRSLAAEGPFDFVFIDAEKSGYFAYLDWALENVRVGGIIAAHNAFRKGSVAGQAAPDEHTATMQAFNQRMATDPRLLSTIFPAGDGTLVAIKTA
jgi:caffeoyl-CoA O-methyltransferase